MNDADLQQVLEVIFGTTSIRRQGEGWSVGPVDRSVPEVEALYDKAYALEGFFSYLGYQLVLADGQDFMFELKRQ